MGILLADGAPRADIPAGYKRTEAGVISSRWRSSSVPVGWTVRSMQSCLRTSPAYGINAAAVPFDDGLPAYLRITDISDDHRFKPSPRVSIEHPNASAFFLKMGDLVFARTGASVGKSYFYDPADGPLVFAGYLIKVQPNPEDIQPAFLAYCVQSERYWDWVASTSIRSGQPGINSQEYGTYQLWLPPLDEQQAIAEALSDVDRLIESLESLIVKKRAIKQAAMQQLLTGKTRLPGFSGERQTIALGEISDIKNGSTPNTQIAAYWNGQIPWCTPTDITDTTGKYLFATERYITEEGLTSCAANLLPAGTLLLCSRATIGEIKIAASQICTNQGFKSLVCKDGVSNEFLYYLLITLKPKLFERAIGSTFLEIGKREVASLEVNLPPLEEQRALAAVLSDMDAEIATLERRRDKIRTLKQGMMQQLLTGRTRLLTPE